MMNDKKICVGAIAGAFGVQGEARLKSFCANAKDIAKYSPLYDEKGALYTLKSLREIKDGLAARFDEVKTREEVAEKKGTRLYASRENFPELEEEEYYHSDLIGLMAYDGHGAKIGKVKAVLNYGAGDILELHFGAKTVLLPFTQANVPTVDIQTSRIIIDPPEGVFDA